MKARIVSRLVLAASSDGPLRIADCAPWSADRVLSRLRFRNAWLSIERVSIYRIVRARSRRNGATGGGAGLEAEVVVAQGTARKCADLLRVTSWVSAPLCSTGAGL